MNNFLVTFKKIQCSFVCTRLNSFKYFYVTLSIQFNISHLFAHSQMIKQFYLTHGWDPNRFYYSESEWTWE